MDLQDLERILSNLFEGVFTKGSHQIQPVEIARELVREMSLQRRVSVSRVYAPNVFVVRLGRADFEKSAPLQQAFCSELEEYICSRAAEKGYTLIGKTVVSFAEDLTMGIGEIEIDASYGPPEGEYEMAVHQNPIQGKAQTVETTPSLDHTMIFSREELDLQRELFLVIIKGPDQGKSVSLHQGKRYLLGRKNTNQLVLSDINASREHALVEYRDGCLYLTDQGSRNGTYVNGVRIQEEYKLESGDQIQIGEDLLQIEGG